jgi:hypothetical protein
MPIRTLTFNGETLTIRQWAARIGLSSHVVRYRLDAGWPIAEVLSPMKQSPGSKSYVAFEDKAARVQRDFNELVHEMNRSLNTFQRRIRWLFEASDTPGVGGNFAENANDRLIPSEQDSRKLEIS